MYGESEPLLPNPVNFTLLPLKYNPVGDELPKWSPVVPICAPLLKIIDFVPLAELEPIYKFPATCAIFVLMRSALIVPVVIFEPLIVV